ncbi:MAG: 3',5'-cyclic-AMP phosphodiesterase [gamma proteobacterium symbiont of Bathyaustriella thionipta]|nr:3',5'-cyclic-AMP phosphodiesterase [gamma proteobacterium symbiont of Bathyaustriella thionipta]
MTASHNLPKDRPTDDLCVLQITDPHLFADKDGQLLGVNTYNTLQQVIQLALDEFPLLDFVIVSGDLVHDHSAKGYKHLQELFSVLNVPIFCLPGNHDESHVMHLQLDSLACCVKRDFQLKNWSFVFLDSSIAGSEKGFLKPAELDALQHSLESHPLQHTMVVLHHQAIHVGSTWIDNMALTNQAELFTILDAYSQVRALVWGHIHQAFQHQRASLQLFGTPSTCVQFKPGEDKFQIDALAPGLRWFKLSADGRIESDVMRLHQLPENLQIGSIGY